MSRHHGLVVAGTLTAYPALKWTRVLVMGQPTYQFGEVVIASRWSAKERYWQVSGPGWLLVPRHHHTLAHAKQAAEYGIHINGLAAAAKKKLG